MSFLKIAWLLGGVFDGSHKGTESFGVGWGVLVLKRIKIKKEGKRSKKKKKKFVLRLLNLAVLRVILCFERWHLLTSKLVLSWAPLPTNFPYTAEKV